MKKYLLVLCASLFLVSCNKNTGGNSSNDDTSLKSFKEVLNLVSTDPYQTKGYEVSFTESYQASGTNEDNDESSSYILNYQAE